MSDHLNHVGGASRALAAVRSSMIVTAVAGIVLGFLLLFWPGISLLVAATLFGVALVVGGLYRIVFGATLPASTGFRWWMIILGVLMAVAGVICLAHPVTTLVFIAIMIGIAWIFQGLHDLIAGIAGTTSGSRWLAAIGGIIGVVAGILVMVLPITALGTFAVFGGILLIVVSIVTLATLPAKTPAA